MASINNPNPTVYSSEHGRICPNCGKPLAQCVCKKTSAFAPMQKTDGIVRLRLERKGRGGKTVTLIQGLPYGDEELKTLAKTLKQRCGSGGAVKDRQIEIQGDVRDLLLPLLQKMGLTVKKAGG